MFAMLLLASCSAVASSRCVLASIPQSKALVSQGRAIFASSLSPGRQCCPLSMVGSPARQARGSFCCGSSAQDLKEWKDPSACSEGGIHLILGPMFAGKTTALLHRIEAEADAGRRIALVKSDKDTRYGLSSIVSHAGERMPCAAVAALEDFKSQNADLYAQAEVIGIDEAQFFDDLLSFCQCAADYDGKTLIVAGLDGDFLRRRFGSALDLVPLADSVTKLSSRCDICRRPAAFTFRKSNDQRKEVIGGSDIYMPVCRKHYVNGQFAIEATRTVLEAHRIDEPSGEIKKKKKLLQS